MSIALRLSAPVESRIPSRQQIFPVTSSMSTTNQPQSENQPPNDNQPLSDDQPTRPSDVWICCNCASPGDILPSASFNIFTLVGDDCPLCSHNRCSKCDPPKDSSKKPDSVDLPPEYLRQPTDTSGTDRGTFLNAFAPHYYFRPEIPWTNVATAYTAWEWLQFYNGGRIFTRRPNPTDQWTLAPLPGNWQCCRCATFNQASVEEAGNRADRQRQECIRKDHFRCNLCFTHPKEGEPMDFRPR